MYNNLEKFYDSILRMKMLIFGVLGNEFQEAYLIDFKQFFNNILKSRKVSIHYCTPNVSQEHKNVVI